MTSAGRAGRKKLFARASYGTVPPRDTAGIARAISPTPQNPLSNDSQVYMLYILVSL